MKKGFTLIELLAVIVILAIIAVIAVPIVIDIIEDTKINSVKTSASMYLKAAELYISNIELNKVKIEPGAYPVTKDGNLCIGIYEENKCNGEIIKIQVKGQKPNKGKIIIDEKGNIEIYYLEISGYVYYNDNDNYIVEKATEESFDSDNGIITLNSSTVPYLTNYRIYGTNSGVGDLVTEEGDNKDKYKILVKVSGRNLYNVEELLYNFQNNLIKYNDYTTTYIQLKPNTTYYMKVFNPIDNRGHFYISNSVAVNGFLPGTISPLINHNSRKNEKTVTLDDTGKLYFGYYAIGGLQVRDNILKNCKLFIIEGNYSADTVPEYEPYVSTEYYDIYLEEPLRCVGEVCDYIEYESGKVVRYIDKDFNILNNHKIENVELPKIKINDKTTNIFIDTSIKPSQFSVNYYK